MTIILYKHRTIAILKRTKSEIRTLEYKKHHDNFLIARPIYLQKASQHSLF